MKRGIKEWAVRVLILLVGLCIAHLGVTLFLVGPVAGVFLPVNGRIIEGIVSHFFPS